MGLRSNHFIPSTSGEKVTGLLCSSLVSSETGRLTKDNTAKVRPAPLRCEILAALMSELGHLQTFGESKRMSALPPESGHPSYAPSCLLGPPADIRSEAARSPLPLGRAVENKLRGSEVFDCDSDRLENRGLANRGRFGSSKNLACFGEDFGLGKDHIP